jgi:hypothetical protein
MAQVNYSQELTIPSGLADLLVAHPVDQMGVVEHLGVVRHLVFVRLEGRVNDFRRGESFLTTI